MENLDQSVTFIVQHKVKPGKQEQYEEWLKKIMSHASRYPGHQGANVIRPSGGSLDYAILVRWANIESAKAWSDSDERKDLIA